LSSINLIWVRELNRQDDLFMGKGLRLFDPLILKGTAKCGKIHPSGIEKESRSIPAVRPVLRILWLGLIFMLFLAGTEATRDFPLTGDDPVIRDAASYLLSCQKEDGGFGNEPDAATSSIVPTADAAMALALTGDISRAKEGGNTPLDYLVANPPAGNSSGGSLGRYVMGIVAAGGDPRDVSGVDYVEKLKDLAKPPYGDENLFSESYILLGLAAAGESESSEAQAFISYVLDKQHSSGGWGWGGGSPDLDTTGIATIALLAAGEDPESQPIMDAIAYIRTQQSDDGGFVSAGMSADSNAISDYWAILALNGAGVDPTEWRKGANTPVSYLLSCQQESGVFWWKPDTQGGAGFLVEATSYSIIALMGETLPITAAARGVEAEAEGAAVTVTVLGDGDPLFSGDLAIGNESFSKDGFEIRNPTVLGALAATGLTYFLTDLDGSGSPAVSDLEGYGAAIYFVDGARQDDPIGEYNLTDDECVVISAPDTVLPLRLTAPEDVVEGTAFTIQVASEDLDDRGLIVSEPVEGATVTVKSDTSSADYTTDEEGKVEVTLNEPGEYRVEAKKDGYIDTFYLNCGYQVITCRSGEPVDVTIHVLGNGVPLFSGEVEVPTADFGKDGFEVDNPTAMGALELTGISYSLSSWSWGLFVSDVAGYGSPSFYANGAQAPVGLDQYYLSDGDCIVVSAPYDVYPLFMDAPTDVVVGEKFKVKVESEEYDINWNLVRVPAKYATVIVGTTAYTTGTDGYTDNITLSQAGEYEAKAEKPGYIGTSYLSCSPHIISCEAGDFVDVTIHVLGAGTELFSDEKTVSSMPFTKDGFNVDNPTAMGALELTGISYSLSSWSWGLFVSDVAGYGSPSFYVDGSLADVGLDQYYLNGDEWITVSAPYFVTPLYLDAPEDAFVGESFEVKVETEEYDANWNLVTVPVIGATVKIDGDPGSPYTTNNTGIATVTLHQTGEYKVEAEKAGYIGTYYLVPGGYHYITATGEIGPLSVIKKADNATAEPGDIINYMIKICNDDQAALSKVNVTDILQMDSEFVYADPWPNETVGNELVWNLPGDLAPGGCEEITLQVKVSETKPLGYILENCANVVAHNDTDDLISAVGCEEVFIGTREPLIVTKTADKESVERGEKVKYTIEVCNLENADITDVVVEDAFNKDVEFVSADPVPVQEYGEGDSFREVIWAYDSIKLDTCEEITLEVIVPEMQDFEFEMEQSVRGEGFVNAANDYTTTPPEYGLINVVNVSAKNSTDSLIEASAIVTIGVTDPGTELSTREHGSGSYDSEELVAVKTEDKLIEMSKDVSATYATTTLGLYNNRSIAYSSRWTETATGKNRITGTTMSEAYRYATSIDRDSHFKLDETSTSMAFDSEFEGMGSFRAFQKPTTEGDPADFESEETYSGSFKIYQVTNGSSIKYEKAASGTGSVSADKRIGDKQRSYEAGSGSYESDEIIEAATNYIAKDISLAYQPTSFDLGGDLSADASNKWKEGIWSKNVSENSTTFIGEEFSSLDRLDKETFVRGLGDVATEAEFSGTGRFRTIYVDTLVNESDNESMKPFREADIEIDEQYSGDYSIQRRVIFAGDFEYDEPHLSAEKSGEIFYQDDAILARYNLTLRNDGNRALGPLVIRDLFPPGAEFVNASERTSSLSPESVEWTFLNLGLGGSLSITLWLDITDCRGDEIVNRIEASAGYNGNATMAAAFSAIETDWLSWTGGASVTATKSGEVDEDDPRIVTYTITVQNLDESTKVATVADLLPEGMRFLDSSVEPSSVEGNTVTWTLIDIGPYEAKRIVYGAEALRSGRFLNRAVVDARSVNGSSTPPVYANAIVEIGEFEGEVELPKPVWQPPDWDFVYMDYENNLTCEEITNLTAPEAAKERGASSWTAESEDEKEEAKSSGEETRDGAAGEVAAADSPRFDEVSGNVDLAVTYLMTCQNEDGGFGPQPGEDSTLASTSLAAIALAAAGMDPASQFKGEKSTADYLIESAPDLANSSNVEAHTGRYVVALVSAGLDPVDIGGTDYVEILRGYSKPSGEIGKEKYIWDDGWVLLGLAAAGEAGSPEASRAAIYLKGLQTASGGWAWHGGAGGEDPDTTGLIVSALLAVGEDESSESVRKALEYFRSEQNDDGGFSSLGSNSATDDWAIMALNGAGEAPEGWRRRSGDPLSHLASLQKEDGSIWWKADSEGSSFEWTALGIVAMSGEAIPPDLP